jgi:hypothetical protein
MNNYISNVKRLMVISLVLAIMLFALYAAIFQETHFLYFYSLILFVFILDLSLLKIRVSKYSIERNLIFFKTKINPKDVKRISIVTIWGRQIRLRGEKNGVVISLTYLKDPTNFVKNLTNLITESNPDVEISDDFIKLYGKPPYINS